MTYPTRSVQLKGQGDEITLLFAPVFDGRMQIGKAGRNPGHEANCTYRRDNLRRARYEHPRI